MARAREVPSVTTSVPTATAVEVVAAAARALAEHGRDGVAEVLRVVRDRLGLVGVVLHDEDGEVVSGVAVPHQRDTCPTVDVPLRAGERLHGWLTVTTVEALAPGQAAAC